jgi:copper(I)-binding protein
LKLIFLHVSNTQNTDIPMTFTSFLLGGFSALAFALPAAADHAAGDHADHDGSAAHSVIMIHDAYARSSGPTAKTGAAFFTVMNHGDIEDRLISAATTASKVVELHTHIDAGDGVMLMRKDEDGFEVTAGGSHELARGGDHVMMMGLTEPFVQGETVELTLTFEQAGDITVTIPIDNERTPAHGEMDHGSMDHSAMGHDASGEAAEDEHAHH